MILTTTRTSRAASGVQRVASQVWSRGLLLGGLVGAGSATLLTGVLAQVFGGVDALASVVLTGALVIAYFVIGQVVERAAFALADLRGLAVVMFSVLARLGVLGAALWLLLADPAAAPWLSRGWFFVAAIVSVAGWLTGVITAHERARRPIYDAEYVVPGMGDAS